METLYNGITIPDNWPPDYSEEQYRDRQPVPYLDHPPEVINITVGRQLFVDSFLIEESDLAPEYHRAEKYAGNPVFRPETPLETLDAPPCAAPKSGGIWYDKSIGRYRMWYEAGFLKAMAYAESDDGIHWERPALDVVPGTNQILPYEDVTFPDGAFHLVNGRQRIAGTEYLRPDSTAVFPDPDTKDPRQRFKMLLRNPGGRYPAIVMTSPDGIHWENASFTFPVGDRSTMFYNPFRKKWVFSIRTVEGVRRRRYAEADDFLTGFRDESKSVHWLAADSACRENPYIRFDPTLYNVDAVAYESIMLGMFQIHYGPENDVCDSYGVPKITELIPMYSRDGFHFSRPSQRSVVQASMVEGSWDRGYIESVGGICDVRADDIRLWYIGFSGLLDGPNRSPRRDCDAGTYHGGALGFATLRRDGFVSQNAEGTGRLLTRRLTCPGKSRLHANFSGTLSVRALDSEGRELSRSVPVTADTTARELPLPGFTAEHSSRPFRLEFTLKEGKLYSFWME